MAHPRGEGKDLPYRQKKAIRVFSPTPLSFFWINLCWWSCAPTECLVLRCRWWVHVVRVMSAVRCETLRALCDGCLPNYLAFSAVSSVCHRVSCRQHQWLRALGTDGVLLKLALRLYQPTREVFWRHHDQRENLFTAQPPPFLPFTRSGQRPDVGRKNN